MKWPDWSVFPLKVVSLGLREVALLLVYCSIGLFAVALWIQNVHRSARGLKPIVINVGARK